MTKRIAELTADDAARASAVMAARTTADHGWQRWELSVHSVTEPEPLAEDTFTSFGEVTGEVLGEQLGLALGRVGLALHGPAINESSSAMSFKVTPVG